MLTIPSFSVMESKNIALQGTLCTSGSGLGVCVGLGDGTVFGRIAKQASSERPARTTLEVEILHFVLIIAGMALCVAVLIVSEYSWALLLSGYGRLMGFCSSVGGLAARCTSWVHQRANSARRLCFSCRCLHSWFVRPLPHPIPSSHIYAEGLPVCVTLSLTVM